MGLKSTMLMAGCLSATTFTVSAADGQRTTQTRFLRKRRNGKVGRKNNTKLQQNRKTTSQHDELDITAEDVGFWTRSLQSSLPPVTTPDPTPVPTDPPVIDTPAPSSPAPSTGAPFTPAPVIVTPAPTIVQFVPTPSPTTLEPTENPTSSPTFTCNLTPEERATAIRELMETVSDPELFDDPSTPQARALDWITNDDQPEQALCPNQENAIGCTRGGQVNSMVQRYIMAAFYFAKGGGSWNQCNAPQDFDDQDSIDDANADCARVVTPFGVSNQRRGDTSTDAWLTPANECEWGGVACWGADTANLNYCADQIDFENFGLSGELIPEVGTLNSLRFLILEQGAMSGPIPTEYGELQRLLILDMDFNELTGSLPEEIYDLSSLQQLDLNDNQLTGSISPRIGDLSLLTFFQIDHNELSSTIPSEMGELSNLRIAFLSDNDIVGAMPEEVCALRNTTSPQGVLGVLVTDCANNEPFEPVDCECCSSCA